MRSSLSTFYMRMLCVVGLLCCVHAQGAKEQIVEPYESGKPAQMTELDRLLQSSLSAAELQFAANCSDAVFLRRVYLDVTGSLPPADGVQPFLQDQSVSKRAELIDALLASEGYAVYWAMRWSDLLRVKSEFPINLWPNAAQAYHEWIYQSLRENKPYDVFARELLTSSGSNFRRPEVNFYRAVQGQDAASLAQAAALAFMGTRLENWPESERLEFEQFFSRIAFKPTAEWKEEIVYVDPEPFTELALVTPDGEAIQMPATGDPREVFADWLIQPQNAWFARNMVNRQWAWLMGRGMIHEPDDIRADNLPTHPELLGYLERELVESGYDMKHVLRVILNSRAYQQSSLPSGDSVSAAEHFACYPVRRLDAEVLADVLCGLTGTEETYVSMIPEPFTYIPSDTRTIAIADGSISSPFLQLFGRPSRDTGLFAERDSSMTDKQALHMLNSSHVLKKINKSTWIRQVSKGTLDREKLTPLYLAFYGRKPMDAEVRIAQQYCAGKGKKRWAATQDLIWAMMNSKEFLYNH
ncbi:MULTISPECIES: DUF1553 domain-containing protein [unclassified Lentimonas]|uniref:DUF1553 domain-containing protein n=1 Tax=unclassified Lentimonas TaxID=2630993 RepID=UPI00138A3ED2|nr:MULTISPECIES: DUF1553 domain-containing protein [unclassified Lentimonas]